MRLVLDLRLETVHSDVGEIEGEVRLRPHDLAAHARRPASLTRLLWGRRWQVARVLRDEVPLDGVQAGAVLLLAATHAQAFEVVTPRGITTHGHVSFVTAASARFAVAMPGELLRTTLLLARVLRVAQRDVALPLGGGKGNGALYLHRPLSAMGSSTGGAAVHTAGVIEGLNQNGVDVEVLGPQPPAGVDTAAFRPVPVRRRYHLVQWLTIGDYSRELSAAVPRREPAFVYERSIAGSYAGLEAARRRRVPLVLEFNGSEVWIAEHWGGRRLAFSSLAAALERRNLRSASLVVVLSRTLEREVLALGVPPHRILVNPVGTDVDGMAALRERDPAVWRRETGQPEAPTVGFIGTFGPWHGVDLLPDMIERTALQRPNVRWLLVGGGSLWAGVAAEIERRDLAGRVTLTGTVPRDRALRLLAGTDVCVSPHVDNSDGSPFFGSPTKLFEYMGLGKAIVASRLEPLADVIEHGRNGLLHPPGDAAAAAGAVIELLDQPARRAEMEGEALRDALNRFTWRAHVGRTLDALARAEASQPPLQ